MRPLFTSAAILAVIFLFSCSDNHPTMPLTKGDPGSANVTVKTGNVGALAKKTDISLSKLCIVLSAPGETSIYDTLPVSGSGATTVSKTYDGLASLLKTWTLSAKSLDSKDSVIHSGRTTFIVRPRQTVTVSLDLSARFSMLKANFFPIRDSVTLCRLKVDRYIVADSSFPKQRLVNDTVALAFDYLTTGADHRIGMDVWGVMWGETKLLYTGDTLINVLPGEDKRYTITLRWVGPTTPPPGAASMTVTLGAVGTVTVDGELEERGEESVVDVDGNVYSTVTIGTQTWMVENLKTTRYNDGAAIPLVTDATAWYALSTPGYCWYDNDPATNKDPYGALYNGYAVNTGKLAPTGWHVATDAEWIMLTTYLGNGSVAGGKLKEAGLTHWISPNTGATNETGFSALPGGWRNTAGGFVDNGIRGYWWSSTEYDAIYTYCYTMHNNNAELWRYWGDKNRGGSVRCVRD